MSHTLLKVCSKSVVLDSLVTSTHYVFKPKVMCHRQLGKAIHVRADCNLKFYYNLFKANPQRHYIGNPNHITRQVLTGTTQFSCVQVYLGISPWGIIINGRTNSRPFRYIEISPTTQIEIILINSYCCLSRWSLYFERLIMPESGQFLVRITVSICGNLRYSYLKDFDSYFV